MRSMRSRLLVGTALGTAIVLAGAGVVLYVLTRASLLAEFDALLSAKARTLAGLVEQEGDKIELDLGEAGLSEFERAERPEYFQIWFDDGRVFARSRSLQGRDLDRIAGPIDAPACRAVTLPDGRRGRIAGVTFYPQQEDEADAAGSPIARRLVLVVAKDTAQIDRTLGALRWLLVAVCGAATVLSLGMLAWVVRSGLRPVEQLAAQIGQVGEKDLSARIELADVPVELRPVVDRLNDLLARLEAAFARERAFSADVAHELRTPLAGLRATLEVALARPRQADAYQAAMAECLAVCEQTQRIVESLLAMARIEAGQWKVDRQRVDLERMLHECWNPLAGHAEARKLDVRWGVQPKLHLYTDPEKLRVVLQNILENAVTYTNRGGAIHIQGVCRNGRIELSITNTGSRLSEQDVEHVFERFWRGDAARAETGVHCGLGLSVSKQLVELLGGAISVESAVGGTFRVTLAFEGAPAHEQRRGR